jgi:hypothetical protein
MFTFNLNPYTQSTLAFKWSANACFSFKVEANCSRSIFNSLRTQLNSFSLLDRLHFKQQIFLFCCWILSSFVRDLSISSYRAVLKGKHSIVALRNRFLTLIHAAHPSNNRPHTKLHFCFACWDTKLFSCRPDLLGAEPPSSSTYLHSTPATQSACPVQTKTYYPEDSPSSPEPTLDASSIF